MSATGLVIQDILDEVGALLDNPISNGDGDPYQQFDGIRWVNDVTDWICTEIDLQYYGGDLTQSTNTSTPYFNYPQGLQYNHPARILAVCIMNPSTSQWSDPIPSVGRQYMDIAAFNQTASGWRSAATQIIPNYWFPSLFVGQGEFNPQPQQALQIRIEYNVGGTQFTGTENITTTSIPAPFVPYKAAISKYLEGKYWQTNQDQKDKALLAFDEAKSLIMRRKQILMRDHRVLKADRGTTSLNQNLLTQYRNNY